MANLWQAQRAERTARAMEEKRQTRELKTERTLARKAVEMGKEVRAPKPYTAHATPCLDDDLSVLA